MTPEEARDHWRVLARQERARLKWDKHATPEIVERRASLYEKTADQIEGIRTGRLEWRRKSDGRYAYFVVAENRWEEA